MSLQIHCFKHRREWGSVTHTHTDAHAHAHTHTYIHVYMGDALKVPLSSQIDLPETLFTAESQTAENESAHFLPQVKVKPYPLFVHRNLQSLSPMAVNPKGQMYTHCYLGSH